MATLDRVVLVGATDRDTSSMRFLVFNTKTAELLSHHQVEIQQKFPKEGWQPVRDNCGLGQGNQRTSLQCYCVA
uniref:Uncharacterized protein n=1 Tax=Sphenodon punctatus TaxID=8508 RepID=A0A8D0FYR1_SPHPU